jgi:hypothetical protein
VGVGAGNLFDQFTGITHAHGIDAKCAQSHHPEISIAHHDGIRRAPLQIGELLGIDEIDL